MDLDVDADVGILVKGEVLDFQPQFYCNVSAWTAGAAWKILFEIFADVVVRVVLCIFCMSVGDFFLPRL